MDRAPSGVGGDRLVNAVVPVDEHDPVGRPGVAPAGRRARPVLVLPAPTWPSPAYGVPSGGCSELRRRRSPPAAPTRARARAARASSAAARATTATAPEGREGDARALPRLHHLRLRRWRGRQAAALQPPAHARFNKAAACAGRLRHRAAAAAGAALGRPDGRRLRAAAGPRVRHPAHAGRDRTRDPGRDAEADGEAEGSPRNGTTNVSLSLPAPTPLPVPAIPVLADKKSPF